jgi:hypothetical protein
MGIQENIEAMCTEKAVYWGNPVNVGEGGFTFDDPIEIDCRWENINQVVSDSKGVEVTCRGLIFVTQDVQEEGFLYRGTLDDLYDSNATDSSAGEVNNPKTIDEAWQIKRFQKTPSLDGEGFLRKAYLTPSLSFGGF